MMKSDAVQSLKSANLKLSFSISPVTKWVLTIVILGAGIALMAYFYTQEQSRNHQLQDQVDKAAMTLVQNNLAMRDLEGQLAEANMSLAELEASVPPAAQTMTLEEKLYYAAADAGVTLNNISVSNLEDANDGGYQSYGVNLSLTGGEENQLRFVGILGYWLPTAEISSSSMGADTMTMVFTVYVQ
jgi:Tfp pilus assembly protein PilO